MRILVQALALASLALSGLLFCRLRSRLGLVLWPLKMLAGPLAVFTVAGGAAAALLGGVVGAPWAVAAGVGGALLSAVYLWRVTRRTGIARSPAFEALEAAGTRGVALRRPMGGVESARAAQGCSHRRACPEDGEGAVCGRPAGARRPSRMAEACPAASGSRAARPLRWHRDVPFWTLAGRGQPLLCDVWQPPEGVANSGLALVYYHSSSWHLADKDVWTRPLFRHLAGQGHVVMDVGYRLCPEVDLLGMLGDAKRAIAWMRANAGRYGADPSRVVAMGASAGGQLALLAAYTPGHPDLTPPDLAAVDTSVCAAVSFYGVADLRAFYACAQALLPGAGLLAKLASAPLLQAVEQVGQLVPGRPIAGQAWKLAQMSCPAMMASLVGGPPERVPGMYELASPVTHAGPLCPPTLLVHGEHDTAVPVGATRALYDRLAAAGAPVCQVVLPQTDHIFDLLLPQTSPAARVAWAHLDRFLASVAGAAA